VAAGRRPFRRPEMAAGAFLAGIREGVSWHLRNRMQVLAEL
jgi:hypothetical protein